MSVYERFGVSPLINAWGTVTVVGGSVMAPEVLAAMTEASRSFVDLPALHRAAGESIARLLGAEAACVTSGASAGLTIAAAACLAGDDPERVKLLPDTTGMRDECVILRSHRNSYDQAVRLSGMRFREVTTAAELTAAITDRTGMVLYMAESEGAEGSLSLEEVAALVSGRDIPLVVDAAAELPPIAGLARFLAAADLVILSGGKELRGPQSSGVILGDARLIEHCHANSFPRHGIGRGMKTDKETIVGLATAVELYVARDEAASFAEWEAMVAELVTGLSALDGAESWRGFPADAGIQPATIPRAYLRAAGHSADVLRARLREASVLVGTDDDALAINPQCLRRDEVPLVIRAIRDALR